MADIKAGVVNLSADNLDLSSFIDAMKNSILENKQTDDDFFDKEEEEDKEVDFKSTSIETILDDIYISLNSSIRNLTSIVDTRFSVLESLLEKEPEVTEDLVESASLMGVENLLIEINDNVSLIDTRFSVLESLLEKEPEVTEDLVESASLMGAENIENLLIEINDNLSVLGTNINDVTETIEDVNKVDEDEKERQQREDDNKKPKTKLTKLGDSVEKGVNTIFPEILSLLLLGAFNLIKNAISEYKEDGIKGLIKSIFAPDSLFASISNYAVIGGTIGLVAGGPIGLVIGGMIGAVVGFLVNMVVKNWDNIKASISYFAEQTFLTLLNVFITMELWFKEYIVQPLEKKILKIKQTMMNIFVNKPIDILMDLLFNVEKIYLNIKKSIMGGIANIVSKVANKFGIGSDFLESLKSTIQETELDLQNIEAMKKAESDRRKQRQEEYDKEIKELEENHKSDLEALKSEKNAITQMKEDRKKEYEQELEKIKKEKALKDKIKEDRDNINKKSKSETLYDKNIKQEKEQPVNVNTNQVAYSNATYNSITNRSFVQM